MSRRVEGWHKNGDREMASETEAGWRFSGLGSQMQSESKVFSSSISAQRGAYSSLKALYVTEI